VVDSLVSWRRLEPVCSQLLGELRAASGRAHERESNECVWRNNRQVGQCRAPELPSGQTEVARRRVSACVKRPLEAIGDCWSAGESEWPESRVKMMSASGGDSGGQHSELEGEQSVEMVAGVGNKQASKKERERERLG